MNRNDAIVRYGVTIVGLCLTVAAVNSEGSCEPPGLPPLETFVMQPISLDSISAWVPADKSGPVINRSCRPRRNNVYSCLLPAGVRHTKTESCPDAVARLLAEHAACHYEQTLPLTIFNGWQWEYSYSLGQFESASYDLDARGGSWENSLEAVLTHTLGSIVGEWIRLPLEGCPPGDVCLEPLEGRIEIHAFSSMRTRDGYPKKRKL